MKGDEGYYDLSSVLRSMRATYLGADLAGPPPSTALRDAVAEQVGALTKGFKGKGGEELPAPARDLTAYHDAFASAAANCSHSDATELLWQREWVCDDCHRVLDRAAMRNAGRYR